MRKNLVFPNFLGLLQYFSLNYLFHSLKEIFMNQIGYLLNDEFNFKEVSAEVHTLKVQVKNLGPVNLVHNPEYVALQPSRTRLGKIYASHL